MWILTLNAAENETLTDYTEETMARGEGRSDSTRKSCDPIDADIEILVEMFTDAALQRW